MLKEIIRGSLSYAGQFSEKRVSKLAILFVLLCLTVYDCIFFAHELRIEILLPWLSLVGYDGYRMTQEKKDSEQK